jgi:pimeloyl-ACP methyl ester carboxylesterase
MIDSQMVVTPAGALHVRVIGAGPPILLLHGFPDSSLGFRDLCEALAERGFRAIAPDLRGYGLSDKPEGLEPYRSSAALADIAAVARWASDGPVTVLGHDWGGTLAYCFATEHPELVQKLIVINAAHPESYARALTRSLQLLRSWYILPAAWHRRVVHHSALVVPLAPAQARRAARAPRGSAHRSRAARAAPARGGPSRAQLLPRGRALAD